MPRNAQWQVHMTIYWAKLTEAWNIIHPSMYRDLKRTILSGGLEINTLLNVRIPPMVHHIFATYMADSVQI